MDNKNPPNNPLEAQLKARLDRRRRTSTLRTLTLNSSTIDFSSNDFLSLSTSPVLKRAFQQELASTTLPLGSGGSRLLDGNSSYAERLERTIADFHNAQTGLLFNSGFDANAGFFACVPQQGDVVVYDALIHASVHDGMRLSRAKERVPFKHNCVSDLREVLENLLREKKELKERKCHVVIAVEAIYSMDGDVAPLKEIVELVDEVLPSGTGYVVVDEAHSTGVLGPQGRGLVCELGLEESVFARLHTFGKSLASSGAIILGSQTLREYLINYARPLIYTTFLSYPTLAAIQASYSLLQTGKTVELVTHLQDMIQLLYLELNSLKKRSRAGQLLLKIPEECPHSPIFSIQLEEPKLLARYLQQQGMMVRAVVPPTVPEGTSRVRICLHAGNTVKEIDALVQAIKDWCCNKVGIEGNDGIRQSRQSSASAMSARL